MNSDYSKELYDRTERLVGDFGVEKLKKSRVLVVGLGGVGGYIVEALARAGVGTIGICDFDKVDPTNLNRQIISNLDNIGLSKVSAVKKRILSINPNCNVLSFDFVLNSDRLTELNITSWDFIADAIDDVPAKIALISDAYSKNVPIICSMGTGNKLDPFGFKIAPIEKTKGDALARAMRKRLKDSGIKNIPVLYSEEQAVVDIKQGSPIPTISYMPAVAGLEISSYIIKNILKNA